MASKKYCDKCGKDITGESYTRVAFYGYKDYNGLDYCSRCMKKIYKLLRG